MSTPGALFPLTRSRVVVLVLSLWTIYGVYFALQTYYTFLGKPGAETTLGDAFLSQLLSAWVWAVGTLAVAWIARRRPIERQNWKRRLWLYVAGSIVFTVVVGLIHATIDNWVFRGGKDPLLEWLRIALFLADREMVVYWVAVAVAHAHDYYVHFRDTALRASQLATELATTRLEFLKAQIHPQFLFHALDTISAKIDEDPKTADRMVTRLGDFLRANLSATNGRDVSLAQELDLLGAYLEIELARFAGRLTVDVDVPAELMDVRVPADILQPLVENVIRCGTGGRVRVSGRRENGTVLFRVSGSGFSDLSATELRSSLDDTRSRLEQLYGDEPRVTIDVWDSGSAFAVALPVPLRV